MFIESFSKAVLPYENDTFPRSGMLHCQLSGSSVAEDKLQYVFF